MMTLKNLNYPLDFKFKISTLSSDFNITDANGNYVCYVRQKLFKLKEKVVVFSDESRREELYHIAANQWIDFNASYALRDHLGNLVGTLARKGMRSLWKSTYEVLDENKQVQYHISERNAWVKFLDSFVGELPIIGFFTGYFLNPTYDVKDRNGNLLFELKKMPSFFGRRFQLSRKIDIAGDKESLIILSLMMMVLLERARG